MTSFKSTIFLCLISLKRDISLIAVLGIPSFSTCRNSFKKRFNKFTSEFIFFKAMISLVFLFKHL